MASGSDHAAGGAGMGIGMEVGVAHRDSDHVG
jgi:hypothetical protein